MFGKLHKMVFNEHAMIRQGFDKGEDASMFLAVDVGGTAVKLGLITRERTIATRRERNFAEDGFRKPVMSVILREAEALVRENGCCPEGIGVSCTGQVDDRSGCVIGSNGSIGDFEPLPFKAEMEKLFGVPAWVLNDANAAVLGEQYAGKAMGCEDVLMITLGTGVGGGIISGGRLVAGVGGIAGEIGHLSMDPRGERCECGRRGCYERYASTGALVRSAKTAGRTDLPDGRAIFRAAENGDVSAAGLLDAWIHHIANGLISLIYIFNPALVLVGGGVSRQEKLLMEPLRRLIWADTMPQYTEALRLEATGLGNDAGLFGAVRYWMIKQEGK